MEQEVIITHTIRIVCTWCSKILDAYWDDGVVYVQPCENCSSDRGTKEEINAKT